MQNDFREADLGAASSWWHEVAEWAYQSCKQFLEAKVDKGSDNNSRPGLIKNGACWGGWDTCPSTNPSYHAPGAYKVMRDYMIAYGTGLGHGSEEGNRLSIRWNDVIKTSYEYVLLPSQCDETGLVPNWYQPSAMEGVEVNRVELE